MRVMRALLLYAKCSLDSRPWRSVVGLEIEAMQHMYILRLCILYMHVLNFVLTYVGVTHTKVSVVRALACMLYCFLKLYM